MIGNTIFELEQVNSTNTYASQLLEKEDVADGYVVWAREQYAGRGQNENTWESEPGKNLTFTVILRPGFLPPGQQFRLNKAITLGVLDFLRETLKREGRGDPGQFSIKWPNDLYYEYRKMGGILIETRIMGSLIDAAVAGIGLNVNQTNFPDPVPNPVSLAQLLGKELKLQDSLLALLWTLDSRYRTLEAGEWLRIDEEFNQSLLGYGHMRCFRHSAGSVDGIVTGTDEIGRLQLQTVAGTVLYFHHKELEYVF